MVRLSALRTRLLYPQETFLVLVLVPQGYSATGRIMSTKNSNDNIGNRTRDIPACSAVPQPTALQRAPIWSRLRGIKQLMLFKTLVLLVQATLEFKLVWDLRITKFLLRCIPKSRAISCFLFKQNHTVTGPIINILIYCILMTNSLDNGTFHSEGPEVDRFCYSLFSSVTHTNFLVDIIYWVAARTLVQ
jgi:hypothetical protein